MKSDRIHTRYAISILAIALSACISLNVQADEEISETRPANPDARIQFIAVTGDFQIIGHNEDRFLLEGQLGEDVKELVIEGSPDDWKIELEAGKSSSNWFEDKSSSDLILYVPTMAQLKVSVVSADLDLENLNGERVEAQSVSGDVMLADVRPQRLKASSVSGDVDVEGGGQVDSDLNTVSGDLEATELRGRMKLQSVSGDLSVEAYDVSDFEAQSVSGDIFATLDTRDQANIEVNAHSGDIELILPGNTEMDFEASTFSGSIENAFGGTVIDKRGPGEEMSFSQGNGGVRINAQSFSGDIYIERN